MSWAAATILDGSLFRPRGGAAAASFAANHRTSQSLNSDSSLSNIELRQCGLSETYILALKVTLQIDVFKKLFLRVVLWPLQFATTSDHISTEGWVYDFVEFRDFLIYDDNNQFKEFRKDGIGVEFAHSVDLVFFAAIDENTKTNFVKTIGNPKYNVARIPDQAGESARIAQRVVVESSKVRDAKTLVIHPATTTRQ
ncbi:hypothetical protein EDD22DRAFT_845904 [Suillus occidentalis]|nr:hypothetical protein EDD22DRAFT_845904 [Suillus occidentalis]